MSNMYNWRNQVRVFGRFQLPVWALLCLIVLFAFTLRMYRLGDTSAFYDEEDALLSAMGQAGMPFKGSLTDPEYAKIVLPQDTLARRSIVFAEELRAKNTLSNVIAGTLQVDNGNMVAHRILLHYWFKAFGVGIQQARMLSVVFGVGTVLLLYFFAFQMTRSQGISLLSALILACMPLHIQFSREMRSYSMAPFFLLAATVLFLRILSTERSEVNTDTWEGNTTESKTYTLWHYMLLGVGYGMCVSLALLAHYSSAAVVAVHGVWGIIFIRKTKQWVSIGAAILVVVGLVGFWLVSAGYSGLQRGNKVLASSVQRIEKNAPYDLGHAHSTSIGVVSIYSAKFSALLFNVRTGFLSSQSVQRIAGKIPGVVLILIMLSSVTFVAMLYLLWGYREIGTNVKTYVLALALVTLPYVIYLSFQSGTTIPFVHRYAVFGLPFSAVILAIAIAGILDVHSKPGRVFVSSLFVLQMVVLSAWAMTNIWEIGAVQEGNVRNLQVIHTDVIQQADALAAQDTLIAPNWREAALVSVMSQKNVRIMVDSSQKKTEIVAGTALGRKAITERIVPRNE